MQLDQLSEKHILKCCPASYRDDFVSAVTNVFGDPAPAKMLQSKFFIPDDHDFSAEVFCRFAAELSVANHLKLANVSALATDKTVNPDNDQNVDVYFEVGGIRVSLEVKCPDQPLPSEGAYVLETAGRIRDHEEVIGELQRLFASGHHKLERGKNKDLTLGDYLVDANSKFSPASTVDDVNILLIACGDVMHIQKWRSYLYQRAGYFTPYPLIPPSKFALVDIVMLSSLRYCHSRAQAFHDWTLKDVFLLPCISPYRRSSCLAESIRKALSPFDHHLKKFSDFSVEWGKGEVPPEALDAVKPLHYVMEKLDLSDRERYFPGMMQQQDKHVHVGVD